jgi:hypothetical protein
MMGGGGFGAGISAGSGFGGEHMGMIGGAGGSELMGMVPQLMRMANAGGGHSRRRLRK